MHFSLGLGISLVFKIGGKCTVKRLKSIGFTIYSIKAWFALVVNVWRRHYST